jgi:hypothetical protein
MVPNHLQLNRPLQLGERPDLARWGQCAKTARPDPLATRRGAVTRQVKKWLTTAVRGALRGQAMPAGEVRIRGQAMGSGVRVREGATESAAWVQAGATAAAGRVREEATAAAVMAREEATGAAVMAREEATGAAVMAREEATAAVLGVREQSTEAAELQRTKLVTGSRPGPTWSQLASATPRTSWPGSPCATPRAQT